MSGQTSGPDEPWQVRHARELLAESMAAESTKENAARYWGRFEYVVEALLDHIDHQGGQK